MSEANILHCILYIMQHITEYEMSELNVTLGKQLFMIFMK